MRIPLWKDLRLSVWERQNPNAVKVTLARSKPYEPVRRVLSMRGWMLLWVRYDWKDYSQPEPDDQQRLREQPERPTHPDGTPYRYADMVAEGWEFCDGCRLWTTANVERPHECARTYIWGPFAANEAGEADQ
jgi:hypothetical protein